MADLEMARLQVLHAKGRVVIVGATAGMDRERLRQLVKACKTHGYGRRPNIADDMQGARFWLRLWDHAAHEVASRGRK